jgi:dihydrofolate reductase
VPQDRRTTWRIALSGSVSVVRQLLDADLLHELHLFVDPANAGESSSGDRTIDLT